MVDFARSGDSYDVVQFARLFLDLGGEEEGGARYRVPWEVGERVEHVEAVHVDNGRVDAQLRSELALRKTRRNAYHNK